MADDTRVTRTRSRFACAMVLLWALGVLLPQGARAADIIVRRDQGLTASERAQLRADAGVEHERMLSLPNTEVVSVPDADEAAALAALNADPDVVVAAPNVVVHVAAVRAELEHYFPRVSGATTPTSTPPRRGTRRMRRVRRDGRGGRPDRRRRAPRPAGQGRAGAEELRHRRRRAPRPRRPASPTTAPRWRASSRRCATTMTASPASRRSPRPCCRCRRSTTAATGKIADVLEAFSWAGEQLDPDRRRVVRHRPVLVQDDEAHAWTSSSATSWTPIRTRCTSSPPATEGADVDDPGNAVYPVQQRRAEHHLRRHVGRRGQARVLEQRRQDVGGPLRARASTSTVDGVSRPRATATCLAAAARRCPTPLVAGAAALLKSKSDTLNADADQGGAARRRRRLRAARARSPVSGGRLNAARPLLEAGADRLLRGGARAGRAASGRRATRITTVSASATTSARAWPARPRTAAARTRTRTGASTLIDNCPRRREPGLGRHRR